MKQKNRITAALLALVFGGIGVHRFYLGKIVSGIFISYSVGRLSRQLSH